MYNTHKMAGLEVGGEIRREKGKMSKKVMRHEEDVKMGRKEKKGRWRREMRKRRDEEMKCIRRWG